MKQLAVSIIVLVASVNAHAATVLIDFEEVTPDYSFGSLIPSVESKGYSFEPMTWFASPPESGVSANGIFAAADCFAWGPGCGAMVSMEALDGKPFAIHSIGSSSGDFGGTLWQ